MSEQNYFQACEEIAKATLHRFGLGQCRNWSDAVQTYIREQVEYSSWTVSVRHAEDVVHYSRNRMKFPKESRHPAAVMALAARMMQADVRDQLAVLVARSEPKMWKIRFRQGKRFMTFADLDAWNDDRLDEVSFQHRHLVDSALAMLQDQYARALLPVPEYEVVGFNSVDEEIPQ